MIRYGLKAVRPHPSEPNKFLSLFPSPIEVTYEVGRLTQAPAEPIKDGYGLLVTDDGFGADRGIPLACCWSTHDEMPLPELRWDIRFRRWETPAGGGLFF